MSLATFTPLPTPPSLPPLLLPPTVSHHHHHPNGTLSSSRLLSPPPTPTLSTTSVFRAPPLPKGSHIHHSKHQSSPVYHNATEFKDFFISPTSNSTNTSSGQICVHRLCVRQNGQATTAVEICTNDKGEMVKHGEPFIPQGGDTCTQCTCMNGKAEMCISVLCSPPDNCRKFHKVSGNCCEFLCLEGDMTTGLKFFNKTILTKGEKFSSLSTGNLGLRLIASTITSFLILALLLFMIHRLRQRRLLLMIRRLQTRRLEQLNGRDSTPGAPGGPGSQLMSDAAFRFGYFGIGLGGRERSREGSGPLGFGFIEPPPPYTFWKPPEQFIAPGEAPPSYEETINPNTIQQLPACFPTDPVPPPPNINPQVQHLNATYHGGFSPVSPPPPGSYPVYTAPTPTAGTVPGTAGRVISLTNSSIANLAGCLQQPQPTNVHLNRLGPGQLLEQAELASEENRDLSSLPTAQQTYSKGHFLAPQGSLLVRHNSMPMSRNSHNNFGGNSNSRLYHHPTFHQQQSGPASGTYPNAYQQRLVTHLASPLNDSSQAYITSPVLSTDDGTVQLHHPIIDTITSDSNYEHITVLRIGSPAGVPNSGYASRVYAGNGRLIGSHGGIHREGIYGTAYTGQSRGQSRPMSALMMTGEPPTITGNRTVIATTHEPQPQPRSLKPKSSSLKNYRAQHCGTLPRVASAESGKDFREENVSASCDSVKDVSTSSISSSMSSLLLPSSSSSASSIVNSPVSAESADVAQSGPKARHPTTSETAAVIPTAGSSDTSSSSSSSQSTVIHREGHSQLDHDPTDEDSRVLLEDRLSTYSDHTVRSSSSFSGATRSHLNKCAKAMAVPLPSNTSGGEPSATMMTISRL